MKKEKIYPIDLLLFVLGTAIFAFGLVHFNIANHLAEGGITGISLILRALFHINPAYSTFILNIPLFLLNGLLLGKRHVGFALFGTGLTSFWIWLFQKLPLTINIEQDLLLAALLAGGCAGIGLGLVFRAGGVSGGVDILARILEQKKGISMGKSLFAFDAIVLCASFLYIDLKHILYTLIATFIFSRLVEFVQSGGYTARGMLIISDKSEEIAESILHSLKRGVTFLNGEGGYVHDKKQIIYVVLSPSEINSMKHLIGTIDSTAFISIINVHEIIGEGFTYEKSMPQKS